MPSRGIHHIDLAVANVERSLAFYLDLLGPLGWEESIRYATYRGTEEVVYLKDASSGSREPGADSSMLGIRQADWDGYRYHGVGIEHLAFLVDRREEVDAAHARCVDRGATIHFPPEEDRDEPGYYALFVFDPDGIRIEIFCWD